MKISYRTQTLITLRNLEKAYGRGIKFDELVEGCDFDRTIVSKSLDSLEDMGLVNQSNAEWLEIEGVWSKGITTVKECQPIIDEAIMKIAQLENAPSDTPTAKVCEGEDACPKCEGTGKWWNISRKEGDYNTHVDGGKCPDCGGSGKVSEQSREDEVKKSEVRCEDCVSIAEETVLGRSCFKYDQEGIDFRPNLDSTMLPNKCQHFTPKPKGGVTYDKEGLN